MSKLQKTIERLDAEGREVVFRDCERCGIGLPVEGEEPQCQDCKGLNAYKPNNRQSAQVKGAGNFAPIDPAYEISIHFPKQPQYDPTQMTLDALRIPYFTYTATKDPLEVAYARNLAASTETVWPIVVITAHGQITDYWQGFDLHQLNLIPAAREAAIQMSQTPHDFDEVRVPAESRKAA